MPREGTSKWERIQVAMTFAESGERDAAREIMADHEKYPVQYDECQYGDNEVCYSQIFRN